MKLMCSKIFKSKNFIIILLFLITSCKSDEKVTNLKLAHGLSVTTPVHKAMVFMSERVNEKSDGRLNIDIYPNQQLGTERESMELLQIGSLAMTKVSVGILDNFIPRYKIFGLPFLFRDSQHLHKVLESEIGEELLNASLPIRMKGLTFYDAGYRSFYSNTPMETLDDLKGLKIRVQESTAAINMVRLLGGSPTPISWGELYTALQQGIVDGAENNLPSFYLSGHYEVSKHLMLDEHTAVPDELFISTVVWNDLTEQEQIWLKEAAMESAEYEKEVWKEAEKEAMEAITKAGVIVTNPDKELFREKVRPMYEEFSQDPEMKQLIEAIQAIK